MLVRSYWRLGIPSFRSPGGGVSTRLLGRGRPLIEPVRVGALHITALRTRGRGTFVVFCLRCHRSILYLISSCQRCEQFGGHRLGTPGGEGQDSYLFVSHSYVNLLHSHSISNIFQSFAKSTSKPRTRRRATDGDQRDARRDARSTDRTVRT